jgi:hypothetical protein
MSDYFYSSTADPNLARELLAGCADLYIQKEEFIGEAIFGAGASGDDKMILDDGDAAITDQYNSTVADNLYITDDNGKLARGKVDDTIADTSGTEIVFDSASMVLVSDGKTAPTFTDGETYNVKVLSGSNKNLFGDYFGYTDDSVEWDNSIETEPLEVCNEDGAMVEIAENATKRMNAMNGATFNVPNSDVISKIMNMEKYGLNEGTTEEYHGGSAPDISKYYMLTGVMKDWVGKKLAIQLFRGQLFASGAVPLSGTGWKKISWNFKGKRDPLRDSYAVDMFRFIRFEE